MISNLPSAFVISVLVCCLSGCTGIKLNIHEPVVSNVKYDSVTKNHFVMKVVDMRTDKWFNRPIAGLRNTEIKLENIGDPIDWLGKALIKEFASRGVTLEIIGKEALTQPDIILTIKKYDIVSHTSGAAFWEPYHSFMGEVSSPGHSCVIPAYFYNGSRAVWSTSEVEEPSYNMPMSILVKEIASKVNRCVMQNSVGTESVKVINDRLIEKMNVSAEEACFCAIALGGSNNPEAMNMLIVAANNTNQLVRACALSAIGMLGSSSEFEFLKNKYNQCGEVEKSMALKSIGDIGTSEADDFITNAKKSPSYLKEYGFKYSVDLFKNK